MVTDIALPIITPETDERLHTLVGAFLAENAIHNLSAFRTEENCWIGNVLDSLSFLSIPTMQDLRGKKILDIGTGGGFPLLPLAISAPQTWFTGLDSTKKKIDAIGRIADAVGLQNVELLCGRTEEAGHDPAHRERYDIVTARALAPLNVLLEYASPFVKVGGIVVAWKSLTIDDELQDSLLARAEFSCHLTAQYRYALPGDWGSRQLLIFEKGFRLKKEYPRGVGVPSKQPLR